MTGSIHTLPSDVRVPEHSHGGRQGWRTQYRSRLRAVRGGARLPSRDVNGLAECVDKPVLYATEGPAETTGV